MVDMLAGCAMSSVERVTMATFRSILAYLIALAVTAAPLAATVMAGTQPASVAPTHSRAAPMHDCHSMAAGQHHGHGDTDGAAAIQHSHDIASQDTEKGECPDCGAKRHSKCVGDGGKCCKLTGMVTALPAVLASAQITELAANPPMLTGREIRPPPPPPRA
jgi:ribosomal protein L37AE/L43A